MISAAVMTVEGLTDKESIEKIKIALTSLPGVLGAKVIPEKKIVTVDFDTERVDVQELSRAIRAAGFLPA